MVKDPYSVLGVSESAAQDEIKSAYRRMAKQYHPDLHPDDPKAAEKFSEVNEAYQILSDPEKMRQWKYSQQYGNRPGNGGASWYWQPNNDSSSGSQQNGYGGSYYGGQQGGYYDFSDIFNSFFGGTQNNTSNEEQRKTYYGGYYGRRPFSIGRILLYFILIRFFFRMLLAMMSIGR